jgi:tetratricopeptide (TPR) repeat protein
LKKFVFALAGPLTNGLIAFLLWKIGGLVMPHEFSGLFEGLHPLVVLFLANVFICGVNLVPYTHLMAIGPIQSDGAQIINAPFIKSAAIDDSIFWTLTREVHECCLQRKYDLASEILREGVGRYPDRPVLPFLQGAVALGLQKWEESRQYSLAAAGQLSSTPFLEALAQMNIAYANAMLARPELSQEADQLSAKSMSASGWAPAVKTARGMVLVQHGELEEGRRLLEQSCNSTQDPVHRAENKCWIAIAAVRQGQIEEAEHYLAEARTLDPACPVLDRTEEALRTRESRSPWSRNAAH